MNQFSSVLINLEENSQNLFNKSSISHSDPIVINHLKCSIGQNWAIACSGGADSIFALLLVYQLFPENRKNLTVIHYNHRLRGLDSEYDQNFVNEIANALNLNFNSENAESAKRMDEGFLRDQRRKFFCRVMIENQAKILIQGHNLDDVAETMLWRIPRGVGIEGLSSPKPINRYKSFYFVRPILSYPRDEIRRLLNLNNIPWREDSSNKTKNYLRNRLRLNTLANWKMDSDRDLLNGVKRTRELIEEQEMALNEFAEITYKKCKNKNEILTKKLLKKPKAIVRKVLTYWLSDIIDSKNIHQYHLDEIIDYILKGRDFKIQLSAKTKIQLSNNLLKVIKFKGKKFNWGLCCFPFNSTIYFPNGSVLRSELIKISSKFNHDIISGNVDQKCHAYLSYKKLTDGLFYRNRENGDRFYPIGIKGSKKVKDCFIDKKWSQEKRNNTALVTDFSGNIVWIPEFPPSRFSCIDSSDVMVIRLTYFESIT